MNDATLTTVFVASMVTAIFTGLGALPFLFINNFSKYWLGISNSLAAGLMLGASHQLIAEGADLSPSKMLMGMLIGLVLVVVANKFIEKNDGFAIQNLVQADAKKMLLIIGIMTAHSFAEGVGIGVSFGGREDLGVFITSAIAIHNIPEGLAISLVLIPRGISVLRAAGWSIFTSLPQPLMAIPAYLFVLFFAPLLPLGLGLAAGAMIWMVFAELIPDALKGIDGATAGVSVTLAFAAMQAFQFYLL